MKVSVVMPMYNAIPFLRTAVNTILSQTLSDFEFIIVDDGSIDESSDIINSYNDDRIRLFVRKHYGVSKTLNFGISKCRSAYVARMDSDDIAHHDRLKKQLEFMETNPNVVLLGSAYKKCDEYGRELSSPVILTKNDDIKARILVKNQFGHSTVMIKKSVFDEVGVYEEEDWVTTAEDYDLWLRISEKFEVANLPDFLMTYRVHQRAVTSMMKSINHTAKFECIKRAKERRLKKS